MNRYHKLAETPLVSRVVDSDDLDPDEGNMSFRLKWADGNARDGVGDVTVVDGIDWWSRFEKNPIVLLDHGKVEALPIGLAEHPLTQTCTIEVNAEARTGHARVFLYQGGNRQHAQLCEQLFDLVRKRLLRSGSFGYQLVQFEDIPADYATGVQAGKLIHRCLLLEISLVVLPANAMTAGKVLDPAFRAAGQKLSPVLVKSLLGGATPALSYWGRKRQARQAASLAALKEIVGLTMDQAAQVRDLTKAAEALAKRRSAR